ncbi:EF-hand calcium-binding domain-containing protein 5-like [Dendronephthya gigantea]|uniref:EF-hand calcium-binding domain-containing protein 5-like n=1 Tax=Dendronephthya gigantea TaxID=151771 RepID=UPI00106B1590|nr:EF-hand calcium-binding domain-containing protein 5-like [Dendronephthya gigantea]
MANVMVAQKPITDVKKQNQVDEESSNSKRIASPYIAQLARNSARRWRSKHEAIINKRIEKVKAERKKRLREMNFPQNRIVPLDVLAREWLDDNPVGMEQRIYLIENLFPSLIMGLEKLLTEVEKRELVEKNTVATFNPVNYLAQYLMRNNPRYSNFPEASPYAKGLRKVAEDLKSEIYEIDSNQLAILKSSVQVKRMEREKMERMKGEELDRRSLLLENMFVNWAQNDGTISLSMVQNAICSFRERSEALPKEIRREAYFAMDPPNFESQGALLGVHEFKEILNTCTISLSNPAFEKFLEHFAQCAYDFQQAAERVTIRYAFKALFLACDHDAVGVLDRHRVLEILGNYYDSSTQEIKMTLRNPRKWPIVDIEECEDFALAEEQRKGELLKEATETSDPNEHKQPEVLPLDTEEKEEEVPSKISETIMAEVKEGKEDTTKVHEDLQDDKTKDDVLEKKDETQKDSSEGQLKLEEEVQDKIEDNKKVRPKQSLEFSEDEMSSSSHSIITEERPQSVMTGSAFDKNLLNQTQFVNLCEQFLGDEPLRSALDSLVRFIKASYSETDEERFARQEKARKEARLSKRKHMVDQLFDFWDVDRSGTLNFHEVIEILSRWKDISAQPLFQECKEYKSILPSITCSELHEYIDAICTSCFPHEDPFEPIVIFLHTSIERTFEERKRGEARKSWLKDIDLAAKSSGGVVDVIYEAVFRALFKDAEAHGRGKVISASIALLEDNLNPEKQHRGETLLRYVAATPNDAAFVLKKCLYRDMRCASFTVVDSGKPIHVTKVSSHPGVYLWNPARKETGACGSLIILPIKDYQKTVTGVMAVDTLDDPMEKSVFITHEISFYQGVVKALSQGMQFIAVSSKTVKIADSALSWIHRRTQSVQNSNFYLVEPGLHPADGLVLRRMFAINYERKREYFTDRERLNRKDNLFRDYLFKCVESSEPITADAYGERHLAFPIRGQDGVAIAVADISIGDVKLLPEHEMNEIQKMLRLLAVAHREVAEEVAGREKNIVLEVEKQNDEFRIQIMFDRLLLTDLRDNVSRLDARAFAEIKSYKDPPKVVHDILKTVLGIFSIEQEEKLENWPTCKQFINNDLVRMITDYDPTAASSLGKVDGKKLSENLEGISHGSVSKQGSLPAQYLFNWAFVCLSLVEHTAKMRQNARVRVKEGAKKTRGTPSPSEDSALSGGASLSPEPKGKLKTIVKN